LVGPERPSDKLDRLDKAASAQSESVWLERTARWL
jgi:hypothetical protein